MDVIKIILFVAVVSISAYLFLMLIKKKKKPEEQVIDKQINETDKGEEQPKV